MKKLYAALRLLLCCALSLSLGLPAYAGTTITYIHNDIAGTPVAASDSVGKLLWKESYYPYGEQIRHTGDSTNKVWFHGKPFDKTTGLSYFGARYYDPVIGRFMGVDPVGVDEGNIHSFNRYAYGNNNPYRFVDPNGMWAEDIVLAIPGLVMGAHSLGSNLSSGDYSGAAVDSLGMVADGVALAFPGIPGGVGLAIAATRKASSSVAREGAVSLEKQAADLIPLNANRNRVTLRSEGQQLEIDLAGKAHNGIPTPHTKVSPRNTNAPEHLQPAYNTSESKSTLRPATQEDIRTARRYLESK